MNILRTFGHNVTFNWTKRVIPDNPTAADLEEFTELDIVAVQMSDVLVLICVNDVLYRGSYVEMGVALCSSHPVYLIGHACDSCVFTGHRLIKRFDTIEDFVGFLKSMQ